MPTFVCRIGKADCTVLEERLEAEDAAEARHRLDRQGVVVFAIRPAGRLQGLSFDLLPSLRRGLAPREFLVFNHELLVLIKAGLPIMKAPGIRGSSPSSTSPRSARANGAATWSKC